MVLCMTYPCIIFLTTLGCWNPTSFPFKAPPSPSSLLVLSSTYNSYEYSFSRTSCCYSTIIFHSQIYLLEYASINCILTDIIFLPFKKSFWDLLPLNSSFWALWNFTFVGINDCLQHLRYKPANRTPRVWYYIAGFY